MSQAYRTARVADASRWRTSSQVYGAFYKLPPRESVKDPQHSLLAALAPAVEPPSAAADSQGFVLQARVVPQPGDGACLFHSLADGHQAEPLRLRHAIADFIESQPDSIICGEPLRAWVKWESRLPPALYAARCSWWRGRGQRTCPGSTWHACVGVGACAPCVCSH